MNRDNIFSIHDFSHGTLWKQETVLWDPLHNLKKYFSSYLGKIEIDIPKNVFLENESQIFIGKNTKIEPGVYIKGPCIIGANSTLRHGAYLRGHVITGARCIIGHDTEIKHSLLLNDVKAAHFAYIGDSILGNRVNLGAGVKCANFRLDQEEISILIGEKKINTGLKKFGALIGDDVQIGCNSVLNPGTIVGKESFCYPLLSLKGYIPPKSKINR